MFCSIFKEATAVDVSLTHKNSFVSGNCQFKLESIKLHEESCNHKLAKAIVAAKKNPRETPAVKFLFTLNSDTLDKLTKLFKTCHALATMIFQQSADKYISLSLYTENTVSIYLSKLKTPCFVDIYEKSVPGSIFSFSPSSSVIDCEQSLFCSKIRGEKVGEHESRASGEAASARYSRLCCSRVTRDRLLFPRGFSSKRETARSLPQLKPC